MKSLDREKLGRKKFWKELKQCRKQRQPFQIITDKERVEDLPADLKLLLKMAQKQHAVIGISPNDIRIIVAAVVSISTILLAAYMVSKHYDIEVIIDLKTGKVTIKGTKSRRA